MPLTPDIMPSPFDDFSQAGLNPGVSRAVAPPTDTGLPPGYEISPAGNTWRTLRGPHQLSAADPNQALEEYFARVEQPRQDPMSHGVLEADTPAALEESLLRPFYIGAALGAGALGRRSRYGENPLLSAAAIRAMKPEPDKYAHVGSDYIKIPSKGGPAEVVYKGSQEPTASLAVKAQADVLKALIIKTGAEYAKTQDPKRKSELTLSLRNMNQQLADLLATAGGPVAPPVPGAAPAAPAQLPVALPESLDAANALSRFGQMGARQPFAFVGGGPATGSNMAAPTDAPLPPTNSAPVYRTATNKKTGEKMIFKDGKWQRP